MPCPISPPVKMSSLLAHRARSGARAPVDNACPLDDPEERDAASIFVVKSAMLNWFRESITETTKHASSQRVEVVDNCEDTHTRAYTEKETAEESRTR